MKRSGLVAAAVAVVVIAVLWWQRAGDHGAATRATRPDPAVTASSPVTASPGLPQRPPAHVTKLRDATERKQIAERIAASRAHTAPPAPSLPPTAGTGGHEVDLEHVSANLKDALKEAIPFLSYCYRNVDTKRDKTAAVQMTLTGARDVGTLIDADQLVDRDGKPLDAELDACLRSTLESLELPPLDQGDTLKIEYSFRFDD